MSHVDQIRLQVMWNRLNSVVEEQAMTLLRTAFSISVREAGDLSAEVAAPAGRAGGLPGESGRVTLDDGTPLRSKGWQFVPAGRRLVLEAPGGGGYGEPSRRLAEQRADDRRKGYLTEAI